MTFAEHTHRKVILGLIGVILAASASALVACQVPVFRYALERWTVDPYELVIVPRTGGMTPDESAALRFLVAASGSGDAQLNLKVRVDKGARSSPDMTVATLHYPERTDGVDRLPIWKGALTRENARRAIDSPLRREMANRILQGKSAIWLLVESGDQAKDNAAAAVLERELARAKAELKIPEGIIGRNELALRALASADPENVLQSEIPLVIDFALIRVKRSNLEEAIFLEMFLSLEDDLGEWSGEPMVFPVFGRGRVLEPLIGRGISSANIHEHSGYLCGACSCQVKDLNPGMDLLMAVSWDDAIDGSQVVVDRGLPPLEGPAALMKDERVEDLQTKEAVPRDVAAEEETPILRIALISLGAFVLIAGLGAIWLMPR